MRKIKCAICNIPDGRELGHGYVGEFFIIKNKSLCYFCTKDAYNAIKKQIEQEKIEQETMIANDLKEREPILGINEFP